MYFFENCENSLPEQCCRRYQMNVMMEDDHSIRDHSIPSTSHCYQRQIIDGADSLGFEDSFKENAQFLNIYMEAPQPPSDSEGNFSTRTSKKNSPYTHKVIKIGSSCNVSQELASTVYDAAGSSVVYKKTALKKPVVSSFQENKPCMKSPLMKNETRVMFLEQDNYGRYNYEQFSTQGSSCAPVESMRGRGRAEMQRHEKTTNCRPVPNVHCKEVTRATVERNARLQKLVKKIGKLRQKERQAQEWNNYIQSLKNKHQSETMDNASMRTEYINKGFADEISGTDMIEKEEFVRVSVRRSEATSVRTTPPFDPDAPGGACYQNYETLTMPCNFGGYGFYQNQPCFYPAAYQSMSPQFAPQLQQLVPPTQQPLLPYYQFPSQEMERNQNMESPEPIQYCNNNMPKTNNLSSFSNKKYLLVHTAMQTNTDFGMQASQSRENEMNTEDSVDTANTGTSNPQNDSVIIELRHMSKTIEKLNKKSNGIKTHETSLISINEKLDTLLQSINTFMAKVKSQSSALPYPIQDESTPTCSSLYSPASTLANDKSVIVCSRTAPKPRALTDLSKKAMTSSRPRPPHKALTCDKGILNCSRILPPRNLQVSDNVNNNTSNKIVATRSEPYRVPQLEEIVCNVMASAGDSFTVNDGNKRTSSSRSKLDIIRTLLEEIENSRVTRDTDNRMKRGKKKRAPNTYELPKKECWTVTDSLSMTAVLEQKMEEVSLQGSTNDFFYHTKRPGSSNAARRIMSIAVNTEPLSLFSLIRISTDTLKQILSYMPQIDSLLPRYLDCRSFFWHASKRGIPHFSCNICGAAFMRPSQLSDHIASHNLGAVKNCCVCRLALDSQRPDARPGLFPCRYCGQRFIRAYCCQLHQQTCARLHGVKADAKSCLMLLK